ncbi:hypothetical protein K438DRAFT_1992843 [Mycena galopus ATCC 62051]|nr:hypothetical protein K438DRAFT_1992843 [Mycena galopus ATCC 62051]
MHFPTAIFLAVFASSSTLIVSASALTATRTRSRPLNPPLYQAHAIAERRAAAPQAGEYMTNAKRFSLGLPPRKPCSSRRSYLVKRSGTPPVTVQGNILVTETDTSSVLGYLTSSFNDFGEYGYIQSSQSGAMTVSFQYELANPDPSEISITVTNPTVAAYSLLGAVVGYSSYSDDIGLGNSNYQTIAGTIPTAPGSMPQDLDNSYDASTDEDSDIESAIWNFNPATLSLKPQWINTDGSSPTTSIIYVSGEYPMLALTGDPDMFYNDYGVGTNVAFTFVPKIV